MAHNNPDPEPPAAPEPPDSDPEYLPTYTDVPETLPAYTDLPEA